MTDPLTEFLEDRVHAATPPSLTGFDDVRRRAVRQRLRVAAAVAASFAVVGGLGVAGWAARDGRGGAVEPAQSPVVPTSSPSSSRAPSTTYDPDLPDSGIVAVLPDGEQPLPVNDRCWGDQECLRVLMERQTGPDLGSPSVVDFRFGRPGWDFTATFTPLGETCPRATSVEAEPHGDGRFRVDPAGAAGTYQVDLWGTGDDGVVSTRFVWTTTSDGPVEPALGRIQVVPRSRTGPSHAMEVLFTDLPFQPTRGEVGDRATVEVVAADGLRTAVDLPLVVQSLECQQRGTFYYQGEWLTSSETLGRAPWDLTVRVTIRGTQHVGTGRWLGPAPDPNLVPYEPLAWEPALPG